VPYVPHGPTMTIKSSRAIAAVTAFLGLTVLGVLYLASVATGQPALLWVGGLFAAVIIGMVLFMPPTSVTFDGTDLVYRVRGRETRVARDRVTSCALAGQWWAFNDPTGIAILRLPTFQFSPAQVAAFCNKVGLGGFAPPSPVEQGRKDVSSAKSTRAGGVVLSLGVLFILGFSIWLSVSAQDAYARYRAAPICEGASTTSTCRLQAQARVTSTEENRSSTTLHLSLVGSGGDYVASVEKAAAPSIGDVVGVEIWNGKVTRLRESDTLGNPEVNPNLKNQGLLAIWLLFLAPGVAFAVVGHLRLRSARARLQAATAAQASGSVA
jgi:hypothetical protein